MAANKRAWILWEHLFTNTKKKLVVDRSLVNLKNCLVNGQAFSWMKAESTELNPEEEIYHGILNGSYYAFKYDKDGRISYWVYPESSKTSDVLADYFQLSHNYDELMDTWCSKDTYFSKTGPIYKGLRILRQEPFECLISFICSQNNNIPRITKLLDWLRTNYGKFIIKENGKDFYSFPSLEDLQKVTEQDLRNAGFGYRANYLVETIKTIKEKGGEEYLRGLRGKDRQEVQDELTQLKGIGKKVADCIALFSLDCKDAIPVDTHVYQIYEKFYNKGKQTKMGLKAYDQIAEYFREKFGDHAGWAHSFLFTSDLVSFNKVVKTEDSKVKVKIEGEVKIETKVEDGVLTTTVTEKSTSKRKLPSAKAVTKDNSKGSKGVKEEEVDVKKEEIEVKIETKVEDGVVETTTTKKATTERIPRSTRSQTNGKRIKM